MSLWLRREISCSVLSFKKNGDAGGSEPRAGPWLSSADLGGTSPFKGASAGWDDSFHVRLP